MVWKICNVKQYHRIIRFWAQSMNNSLCLLQNFIPRIHVTESDFMILTRNGALCDANGTLGFKEFEVCMREQIRFFAQRKLSETLVHDSFTAPELAQIGAIKIILHELLRSSETSRQLLSSDIENLDSKLYHRAQADPYPKDCNSQIINELQNLRKELRMALGTQPELKSVELQQEGNNFLMSDPKLPIKQKATATAHNARQATLTKIPSHKNRQVEPDTRSELISKIVLNEDIVLAEFENDFRCTDANSVGEPNSTLEPEYGSTTQKHSLYCLRELNGPDKPIDLYSEADSHVKSNGDYKEGLCLNEDQRLPTTSPHTYLDLEVSKSSPSSIVCDDQRSELLRGAGSNLAASVVTGQMLSEELVRLEKHIKSGLQQHEKGLPPESERSYLSTQQLISVGYSHTEGISDSSKKVVQYSVDSSLGIRNSTTPSRNKILNPLVQELESFVEDTTPKI